MIKTQIGQLYSYHGETVELIGKKKYNFGSGAITYYQLKDNNGKVFDARNSDLQNIDLDKYKRSTLEQLQTYPKENEEWLMASLYYDLPMEFVEANIDKLSIAALTENKRLDLYPEFFQKHKAFIKETDRFYVNQFFELYSTKEA